MLGWPLLVFELVFVRDSCDCCSRCRPEGLLSVPELPSLGWEPYPLANGLCRPLPGKSGLEELGDGRHPGVVA